MTMASTMPALLMILVRASTLATNLMSMSGSSGLSLITTNTRYQCYTKKPHLYT